MATVRISQLTAITTPTDDDILIINDGDANTRKITYANLTQGLLNTSAISQTKSGPLTITGALTANANLVVDTDTFYVDSVNDRVGISTSSPDVDLDVNGTIRVRNGSSVQFGDDDNTNHVALKSPSTVASNITLTLPSTLPSAKNLLWADTAGLLDYSTGITYNETDDSLDLGEVKLTDQGLVKFFESGVGSTGYVGFKAPSVVPAANTYTLPAAAPTVSGYLLSSTDAGVLSWVADSASVAGSTTQIQFNDAGSFGASANLTFNTANNTLTTNVVSVDEYKAGKTITATGTTGAQTINKVAGSVNFAAAATSLVVTSDKVTEDSVIIATVATDDSTMKTVAAVAAAGSFTLHANAAATAETRVNFLVIN